MALRRQDVILAGIGVFVAWGFVTYWIPSAPSRYLPWVFSAGAFSSILFFAWIFLTTSRGRKHIPPVDLYGPRVAKFSRPEAWEKEKKALHARSEYLRESIYDGSFLISDNIDGLLDLILRDFVRSWYDRISSRPSFTIEVDKAIRAALINLRDRIFAVDLVAVGTSKIIPLITSHMRDIQEAERIVRGRNLTRNVTESEELDLAIAAKFRDGRLHSAASLAFSDGKAIQQQHLRTIASKLLPKILPRNMTTSPAVTVLIKEIVACAVLSPMMKLLCDPDTWNQAMEAYGRTLLQDRKSVRKLRAALDEHAPQSPRSSKFTQVPKLAPGDNDRKFERFIRAIKQCNTLSDARRFRSEVASQLRKDAAAENSDPTYLRRLETGKRILDQKVAQLGAGGEARPTLSTNVSAKNTTNLAAADKATLRQVLYSSSGLSYFMEFMDRQNLMRLVQFWIVVDGMRNPLEDDNDDPEDAAASNTHWSSTERSEIAQIYEAYLSKPEFRISPEGRQVVVSFLKAGKSATSVQYHAARRVILRAQTSVYREMQDPHFAQFKKTDLFFKWLASDEATGGTKSGTQSPTLHTPDADISPTTTMVPKMPRVQSAKSVLQPAPDLRRAALSSSHLPDLMTKVQPAPRKSVDETGRAPLFDDEYDSEPLAMSTQSLESNNDSKRTEDRTKIVDAMQEALNDIMGDDQDRRSLFSEPSLKSPQDVESMRTSRELFRSATQDPQKAKPSLSSLGLIGGSSRLGVFTDNDLFGDEPKFREDEIEDSDQENKDDDYEVHQADAGDLGLAEAIDSLTQDIERLVVQESIVYSLTSKAELTNNAAELRILQKSKASLQREIHRKELQRQQYIVQESDNSLYGRATVAITSIKVGTEDDGHEYAIYTVEVKRQAGEQMSAAVWTVARRFSEFHELNKRLKARYPQIRHLEFPRRQVMLKLQRDHLQRRRITLEKWLRDLLLVPAICRSRELRAFLSQRAISSSDPNDPDADSRDMVSRLYTSVTDGMEEFLGNIPVLDQLSVAGQNLISAATTQMGASDVDLNSTANLLAADPIPPTEAEAEIRAFDSKDTHLEPFVKPICDLFLEVFSLNTGNSWLRGRAVVVVLHQLLGGTIERKVREGLTSFFEEDNVVKYINMLRDTMWPGGKMRVSVPRTDADKKQSRKEATVLLGTLVPDMAASVVGSRNAKEASRRLVAAMNNQRLNTHLVFTLLDEIVAIIFDEPQLK